jgi:hypothetical protein
MGIEALAGIGFTVASLSTDLAKTAVPLSRGPPYLWIWSTVRR